MKKLRLLAVVLSCLCTIPIYSCENQSSNSMTESSLEEIATNDDLTFKSEYDSLLTPDDKNVLSIYFKNFIEVYNDMNTNRTRINKSEYFKGIEDKLYQQKDTLLDNPSITDDEKQIFAIYVDFAGLSVTSAEYELKIESTLALNFETGESTDTVIDNEIYKEYITSLYNELCDIRDLYFDGCDIPIDTPLETETVTEPTETAKSKTAQRRIKAIISKAEKHKEINGYRSFFNIIPDEAKIVLVDYYGLILSEYNNAYADKYILDIDDDDIYDVKSMSSTSLFFLYSTGELYQFGDGEKEVISDFLQLYECHEYYLEYLNYTSDTIHNSSTLCQDEIYEAYMNDMLEILTSLSTLYFAE